MNLTVGRGVNRWHGSAQKGFERRAWYFFSAENTSFGWSISGRTGFGRSISFFPDAISFFLACNTSMYLPNSASSGFYVFLSEPSVSLSSLIDSMWAKDLSSSLSGCPDHEIQACWPKSLLGQPLEK